VINALIQLSLLAHLGISKRDLCEKLNRWAAAVHFENLRRGIVQEPAHYCAGT
jgi:hypothetical protein